MPVSLTKTARVTVTTDRLSRKVAVLPDDVAQELITAAREGSWHEVDGVNFGTSRWFMPGEPEHTTMAAILDATPGVYLFVNASGWDAADRWWTSDAQLVPTFSRGFHTDGRIRFCG